MEKKQLKLFLCVSESNEDNPMVREWSVVLVRNLTESNPEIQKEIDSLRAIDFDSKSKEFMANFDNGVDSQVLLDNIKNRQNRIDSALQNM